MEECWRGFPKELLSGVFKYLDYKYARVCFVKYMLVSDIKCMIRDCSFEDIVKAKNLTGCLLYTKYRRYRRIDWGYISRNCQLSDAFIERYHNHLHWFWMSHRQKLSEKIIDTFSNRLDWWNVSMSQDLSEYIKDKYKEKIVDKLNSRYRTSE
jgi:hypothetical protein